MGETIRQASGQKRLPSGQYDYTGRLDRVCVCGHRFADHACGVPADCLACGYNPPTKCPCERFRLSRRKRG